MRAGAEDRAQVHPVKAAVETGLAIWNCRKPVIAAVQGYCLGQGAELTAMCDLTIAADDARIGEVEIRLGASPPLFSSPPAMTIKQLKEYLLSGEQYSAHRAMEIGLVNRVVPRDRLMDEVMVVARRLASLSPTAVQADKRLINQHYERMGFLDSIHAAAEDLDARPARTLRGLTSLWLKGQRAMPKYRVPMMSCWISSAPPPMLDANVCR